MDTKTILHHFEETAAFYMKELDRYSAEALAKKPTDDEWSIGQMYDHLLHSANHMQLKAVEACALGQGTVGAEKSEAGAHIFALGQFPPIQIKVPASAQYAPSNEHTPEELKQRLQALVEKMREVEPTLSAISPEQRFSHPRLGHLSAVEWYQLVAMHFNHHLRQKERLDQFVGA
ncbi:DinB family protein [Brevibacillus fluminis]|uniref:DinB family protein n=1 Tax=Brevibacillus fluminis TaxID=511487 RepID=UPI003F8C6FB8